VYPLFMLFPLIAAGWALVLVTRRRSAHWPRTRVICIVSGIALYDLIMTTLGSYGEYPRLHLSFDPLMLVVVVGTLMLLTGPRQRLARPDAPPAPDTSRVEALAAPTTVS